MDLLITINVLMYLFTLLYSIVRTVVFTVLTGRFLLPLQTFPLALILPAPAVAAVPADVLSPASH